MSPFPPLSHTHAPLLPFFSLLFLLSPFPLPPPIPPFPPQSLPPLQQHQCPLPPHQHTPQPINATNPSPQARQPGLLARQAAHISLPSLPLTFFRSVFLPILDPSILLPSPSCSLPLPLPIVPPAAASVSSPPPINTRPNSSMQRILPPKPSC
ncbi:unnamed protein product [Closterium sp. NIES-53]